jgi:hypothetical protein
MAIARRARQAHVVPTVILPMWELEEMPDE